MTETVMRPCGVERPHPTHRYQLGAEMLRCPGVRAEPEPETRRWSPDVEDALEAVGAAMSAAVVPFAQALEDTREAAALTLREMQTLYEHLGELLAYIDRAGLRPNWAKDAEMMERVRANYARLSPTQEGPGHAPKPGEHDPR